MTWVHIFIEIAGYAVVMAGLAYAWAWLDVWCEQANHTEDKP